MRQKTFEAIIDVQNRHIERLERMVEQLFNAKATTPEQTIELNTGQVRPDPALAPMFDTMPGSQINDS